jgi:predicted dehydrogenase
VLRIVVLGAGASGERHARAFAALPDECVLTGVYDSDLPTATATAEALDLPVLDGMVAALDADAAIVAGEVERRVRLGRAALEGGLDVLFEPPLAAAVNDTHALRSALVRAPRRPVAMVAGDLLFDPTVAALRRLVADAREPLISVHAEHVLASAPGPVPRRDSDVVTELMAGQLQVALSIADQPVAATQATGRSLRPGTPLDHAHALLTLEDDAVISLIASRAGGPAVRRIVVTTAGARLTAELDARTIDAVRTARDRGVVQATAEQMAVEGPEPPLEQARAFVRCVQRRTPAKVGIAQAVLAQEALTAITRRIGLVGSRPASR